MTSQLRLPLESDIEQESVQHAREQGCRNVKLDKIERSLPDQEFFLPHGATLLVEFKRPGEKPRPQQLRRFAQFAAIGHPVSVIDSVADFKTLLAEALELL